MRRHLNSLLPSVFLSLLVLAPAASANNCIHRDTDAQVCEGDTVYFWSGIERIMGKVSEVFSSGEVSIRYLKNNGYSDDVVLTAEDLSVSIPCNEGICVDMCVSFRSFGEPLEGNVVAVFADGMAKIHKKGENDSQVAWKHVSLVTKCATCGDC